MLIVACMSTFVAHTSQALTWSQVGKTTAQATWSAARTAFWAIKSSANLVNCCLPQDVSAKIAVGGLGVGMIAAYKSCPKLAAAGLAIGACAGYLNYLYRDRRESKNEFVVKLNPDGESRVEVVVTQESPMECFKRVLWNQEEPNTPGVMVGKGSNFVAPEPKKKPEAQL